MIALYGKSFNYFNSVHGITFKGSVSLRNPTPFIRQNFHGPMVFETSGNNAVLFKGYNSLGYVNHVS